MAGILPEKCFTMATNVDEVSVLEIMKKFSKLLE
jgi:hypothetical protein